MENKNPKRKPTRLKEYDYSSPGTYFITICTKDKENLLSEITVGDGVLDVPQNKLTAYGEIVDKRIKQMNERYDFISVDKYVIMPNHLHLILEITEANDKNKNGTSRTPSPTNSVVSSFVSTFKRFTNSECNRKLWQRSFHDHIIRGEKDYQKIWEYIDTNVANWKKDCFYSL